MKHVWFFFTLFIMGILVSFCFGCSSTYSELKQAEMNRFYDQQSVWILCNVNDVTDKCTKNVWHGPLW